LSQQFALQYTCPRGCFCRRQRTLMNCFDILDDVASSDINFTTAPKKFPTVTL
jgi:hypothetical protein